MKQKIIVSLVLYTFGIVMGFIFLFLFGGEFQDSITFGIFALVLSVSSLMYGVILMNSRRESEGIMITSRLTPLYKFYIPIFIIEILFFNTILLLFNIYPGDDISIFIVVEVMLVLGVLLLLPCIKLYRIYLKDSEIIVDNFFKTNVFSRHEVREVQRVYIFFYKLKLNKISFIIFPKFSESVNLFVIPRSIKILKR